MGGTRSEIAVPGLMTHLDGQIQSRSTRARLHRETCTISRRVHANASSRTQSRTLRRELNPKEPPQACSLLLQRLLSGSPAESSHSSSSMSSSSSSSGRSLGSASSPSPVFFQFFLVALVHHVAVFIRASPHDIYTQNRAHIQRQS